jgi:hypothetical protein
MQHLGFALIVFLYANIAVFTVIGTVWLSRKMFEGKTERIFYSVFLIFIAVTYLAFNLHYGNEAAWEAELSAVAFIAALGFFSFFRTGVLILGYALHGIWDLIHELSQYLETSLIEPELTLIPLGYGVFCLVFDWAIAGYCYARRQAWA